jgi:hypothetical protein
MRRSGDCSERTVAADLTMAERVASVRSSRTGLTYDLVRGVAGIFMRRYHLVNMATMKEWS